MSLQAIKAVLAGKAGASSLDSWVHSWEDRGRKIAAVRRYYEGDHPSNLTAGMRKLLRIESGAVFQEFNDNYQQIIVDTLADRLMVTGIEGDNPAANQWAADVLALNRFDALQLDVHEAVICDGDAFVMVSADENGLPIFSFEPAWDGEEGMLVLYERSNARVPSLAVKVWRERSAEADDVLRVNVYTPYSVERWVGEAHGTLMPYATETQDAIAPWVDNAGMPIGVPVVHFRNRGRRKDNYGRSEIEASIPLQNALNRTIYSMVMAAELTAFQIRWAKGFTPPQDLTPGMWVSISPEAPLTSDENADLGVMPQGEIMPYLDMARFMAGEMGKITRTPSPEFAGSDASSGEALKQREIGLLGKVKRLQITLGNAWEDCMALAARVRAAYGGVNVPETDRWYTRWADPEIRNDKVTVENAVAVADQIGRREFLRSVSGVFGWDESKIEEILAEQAADRNASIEAIGANFNRF